MLTLQSSLPPSFVFRGQFRAIGQQTLFGFPQFFFPNSSKTSFTIFSAGGRRPQEHGRNIQQFFINPTPESTAVVPDSITGSFQFDTDRDPEQPIPVLRPDWICVREHVHYCSGPLSHMRNGVDKTLYDFAMHARHL
jgi:hypothetical protein